jgi:hypothetical protein
MAIKEDVMRKRKMSRCREIGWNQESRHVIEIFCVSLFSLFPRKSKSRSRKAIKANTNHHDYLDERLEDDRTGSRIFSSLYK